MFTNASRIVAVLGNQLHECTYATPEAQVSLRDCILEKELVLTSSLDGIARGRRIQRYRDRVRPRPFKERYVKIKQVCDVFRFGDTVLRKLAWTHDERMSKMILASEIAVIVVIVVIVAISIAIISFLGFGF